MRVTVQSGAECAPPFVEENKRVEAYLDPELPQPPLRRRLRAQWPASTAERRREGRLHLGSRLLAPVEGSGSGSGSGSSFLNHTMTSWRQYSDIRWRESGV
ncbi:hypothetical protein Vafri_8187 [Volvox africanus]|nr:hypothetical protein Vafri_8187 [Volvox africanus]